MIDGAHGTPLGTFHHLKPAPSIIKIYSRIEILLIANRLEYGENTLKRV